MMRKILLTLITLASFASADFAIDYSNQCVKDFYINPARSEVCWILSHNNQLICTTTKGYVKTFIDGYEYNATTGQCRLIASNNSLGLANDDYTYYMSLTGLICGSLIVVGAFMGLRISA